MKILVSLLAISFLAGNSLAIAAPAHPGTDVLNKPVAGSAHTEKYVKRVVYVKKHQKTDPYTGNQDKKNFVGKAPIAKGQTVAAKTIKHQ